MPKRIQMTRKPSLRDVAEVIRRVQLNDPMVMTDWARSNVLLPILQDRLLELANAEGDDDKA